MTKNIRRRKSRKRFKTGSAETWPKERPGFTYDAARVAAEDKMDADWHEAVGRAHAKAVAEWKGDRDDALGVLRAASAHTPPWPPGFQERREWCNRCGQRTERDPNCYARFCRRCNRWIDPRCGDPDCKVCSKRPARPVP